MIRRTLSALCLGASALQGSAYARDYGQLGAIFPIAETDLLAVIKAKLETMGASGEIARINARLKARTIERVNRPAPVEGLFPARESRDWLFDPTISVIEDIKDEDGSVLVPAGTRVNPLDSVPLRQVLLFFDGDSADERRWAVEQRRARPAKLVLTKGAPLEMMKAAQVRVYFDQGGTLVRHFGIRATPARVIQQGRLLHVTEFAIARTAQESQL